MRGGEIVNSDSARDGPRSADLDLASDSVTVWHRSDSKHGSDSEQPGNNQSKNLLGPESIAAVVEDDHNRNRGCPARPVQTIQLCCAAFGPPASEIGKITGQIMESSVQICLTPL